MVLSCCVEFCIHITPVLIIQNMRLCLYGIQEDIFFSEANLFLQKIKRISDRDSVAKTAFYGFRSYYNFLDALNGILDSL